MKKNLLYLIASWACGLFMLYCQAFQPVVLNSLTRILTSADSMADGNRLVAGLCTFFAVGLVLCLLTVSGKIIEQSWVASTVRDESMTLFQRVLFTCNTFLNENEPEKIVKRIDRDVRTCVNFYVVFWSGLPMTVLGLTVSACMMFMGSFEFIEIFGDSHQNGNTILALTIIFLVPFQVIFLLFNNRFIRLENRKATAEENGYLVSTEAFRGIADIRAVNAFRFALGRMSESQTNIKKRTIAMETFFACFRTTDLLVQTVSQMVVLGISAYLIYRGRLTFADYMGFTLLCAMFDKYVKEGIALLFSWQFSRQAKMRIMELYRLPDSFSDAVGVALDEPSCGLKVSALTYATSDGTRILNGLSFNLPLGTHIALVGPSGSGKSTLLKLIMRHLSPTSGKVSLDGIPIDNIRFSEFNRHVTLVPQRPFIFNASIRDNILVGRNLPLTDEQLFDILETCAVTEDIARKALDADAFTVTKNKSDRGTTLREKLFSSTSSENSDIDASLRSLFEKRGLYRQAVCVGLDSIIGYEGKGLSGGQMAKVALARALAGSPDILLLDEVTAPLDDISQERVMKRLTRMMKGRTLVSISHRLSETQSMDRILVLDNGYLVQEGTFAKLGPAHGLFAQLLTEKHPDRN